MYKRRLTTVFMLVALTFLAFSCKKQENNHAFPIKQQKETITSFDEKKETTRGTNGIVHSTPVCITAMMQDSDFIDWDFSNMVHFHEFDTTGYYTYFIPPYYFYENNILCVCVQNDEIALRYAMMFPTDFDYQTYYNQNRTALVSIYSYDYEELFYEGYLNVRNNTFLFSYVNPQLFDDEGKFPPLLHWGDMNLCEQILTGAETVWYGGFIVGGILNPELSILMVLAGEGSGFAYDFMRRKACH